MIYMKRKDIKSEALKRGIQVLEEYKGTRKSKHLGIFIGGRFKGCECEVTYDYLVRKTTSDKPNLFILTDRGKKQYFNKIAKSRGYTIIEYPKELKATNRCILRSPRGNKWDVMWNSFENNKNNNCPKDNVKSLGERIVQTILEENNIEFVSEKGIKTQAKRPQRLDFYFELEGKKYAIEYMGQQHTKQATGSWRKPLEEIKELDRIKEVYCKKNNIALLYIHYPNEDKRDIMNKISYFINKPLEYTDNIEYFCKSDSKRRYTLTNYKKTMFNKRFKKVVGLNIKTLEEVEFDTLKEAQEWVGSTGVRGCVIGTKKTCKGYLWRYKDDDFSEVAKCITDKRIKVYKATKGEEVIKLPLHMMTKRINSDVATITNCAKGKLSNAKGYKIEELEGEEKEEVLNSISYIDYIQNYK